MEQQTIDPKRTPLKQRAMLPGCRPSCLALLLLLLLVSAFGLAGAFFVAPTGQPALSSCSVR